MTKVEVVSEENARERRFLLKDRLELNELIDSGRMVADVGIKKLGLRRQRQIIRQKLTEINWGGVIPSLKELSLE